MSTIRLIVFIAFRQLWARRLLNSIAVCGVALGVITLITMNAIMQGFQMKFKGEILRISPHVILFDQELWAEGSILEQLLGTKKILARVAHQQPSDRRSRIKRPRDILQALEAMPEVRSACESLAGQAILSFGNQDLGVDMRGILPVKQDDCTPMSKYITAGSWRLLDVTSDGVILGSGVAKELGAHVGDRVVIVAPGGAPQTLKVVGIYEAGIPPVDNIRVYVKLTMAQAVLERPKTVGRMEVRLHDPFVSEKIASRMEQMTGYDAESWEETNRNFLDLFVMQNMIVRIVIAGILTVGGFGVLAIQIMIVLQKTRDISILRSVGLRRRDILWVFLLQGIVVALLGASVGDFTGWRLVAFLAQLKVPTETVVKSSTFLVYEDPMFYAWGVLFALVTGVSASFLPAWHGSRVEPVQVLRGQIG